MGTRAYEQTMRQIESPKVSEAKIFSAVTNGLERHAAEGRRSETLKNYLIKNQRLWVAVRNDLASEDNKYPVALKGHLISISHFVDSHTRAFLRGEGEVEDLIEINKQIIAGLSGVAPKTNVEHAAGEPAFGV